MSLSPLECTDERIGTGRRDVVAVTENFELKIGRALPSQWCTGFYLDHGKTYRWIFNHSICASKNTLSRRFGSRFAWATLQYKTDSFTEHSSRLISHTSAEFDVYIRLILYLANESRRSPRPTDLATPGVDCALPAF
ncbi:hypothetical protein EVAR_14400_1 [Eumeta japonica]|uniref:Uncharacterized protein n=1 Tax=Eumeta variegata TaxID=151549 RepID=A0A4C1TXA8_EUMVA|nr:hypothetical protein EVAR_14400_1 [Eumeta japonica]